MKNYDVCIFFVCVVAIGTMAMVGGCAPQDTSDVSYMPYMEVDYVQAKPAVSRPVASRSENPASRKLAPSARYPGDRNWAANGNRPWKHIVIHHSATPNGNAAKFHKMHLDNGWDEMGYHFVIDNGNGGPDGRVEVGSRWRKQKWGAHTGGTPNNEYNNFGIGVCLVGNFTSKKPSSKQMKSLRKLIKYLMSEYGIPASRVLAHKQAPNSNTQCCGRTFIKYLNRTLRPELAKAMQ